MAIIDSDNSLSPVTAGLWLKIVKKTTVNTFQQNFNQNTTALIQEKWTWKCCLPNDNHFFPGLDVLNKLWKHIEDVKDCSLQKIEAI